MKKLLLKSKKNREVAMKSENKRVILKSLVYNNNFIKPIKWNTGENMFKINFNYTKSTRRCIVSNKKNIINKYYNISRIVFLNYAKKKVIPGLIESTW